MTVEGDSGQAVYDLGSWTAEQRDALELALSGRGVAHRWDGTDLVVPDVRRAEVNTVAESFDDRPSTASDVEEEIEPPVGDVREDGGDVEAGSAPAGPGLRWLGFVIDALVFTLVTLVLSGFDVDVRSSSRQELAWSGVVAVYHVVPVALWGFTLGKLLAGTRVVDAARGRRPAWWQAIVRWAVPALPGLLPLLAEPLVFVLPLAQLATYGGVLWDRRRQGLHDKAARTLVVGSRS